ncbi:hypothetical protein [Mycobacterium paragordonae]|uniref:Uncharacterized protein n=1 Tax=Mycobacterium paragordonae TaxID=1389713 RepID=A0AAJ1S0D0_9MYCO|nr:hypothetical protein [Mycobacterium paragordonae]MDP7735131.1 hypothetical protein [Mycobacterium paragordonae]
MKRSPFESYHKRQRQINAKVFDLIQSTAHMCLCDHPQGFHWTTDDGENVGKCVDADCPCEAFDEDVLYEARLHAELAQGRSAKPDNAGDDAVARAMRAEEERDVDADEVWDWALHAKRPNPIGRPRPDTLRDPAAIDALRQLGGSPEDLTG